MHVRWSEGAVADLEQIADHLFAHAPERAPQLVQLLFEAPESLLTFPHRGKKIRYPRAGARAVTVDRRLRGARKWP